MFFRTRLKPLTGFIEEVAVYRFVVLFAVACICLVLAGSAGAQTFSCPAGTEDMLNYCVMNYPDRADYYMGPGNANPIYSAIFPDNGLSFAATGYFVWTKGANGYPWDVKTFDQNFVYDRSTELTWTDPQTFKRFNVESSNVTALRCQGSGESGDSDSGREFELQFLFGMHGIQNGRFEECAEPDFRASASEAGGNIGKVKTRLFTYQYNCDTNYGNCSDKEVFSLGSGVGLYDWKHYVNQNAQWVFVQESTINNKQVGQTTPYFPCPNTYQ